MSDGARIDEVRVLYVGDDPEAAERAAAGLEAERPALAVEATVAGEARAALDGRDIDCVVCAVSDDRALGLIDEMGASAPDAVLVLFAGADDPDLVREAYAAGIDDYVPAVGAEPLVALAHGIAATVRGRRGRGEPPEAGSHAEALTRSASDAVLTVDAESRIRFVNPAIEEVLGYDPDDLLGEPLTVLMSDELAARHVEGLRRYLETGERRLDWDYVELPGMHAAGHEVPLAVSFSEFTLEGERFFSGVLRDVTARREHETERELLSATAELVASAGTLEEGLRAAFAEMGEALGWTYGEAWLPDESGEHLRFGAAWHDSRVDAAAFEAVSAEATFESGSGLPGRVWESGSAEWIPDVTDEGVASVVRADAAREADFGAAFAVPVRTGGRIVAVFTFLLPEPREADERLTRVTSTVAENLGRLVGRKRAERELRREQTLKDRILEASPVGIALVNSDGEIEFANAHAERILAIEGGSAPSLDEFASRIYDPDGDPVPADELPYRHVVATGEGVSTEFQFERSDGERVWLSVNGVPIRDDDGISGVVFAFENVTQARRLETELAESLERVTDAFFAVDTEWRFTYLNETAEELLYRSGNDLSGSVVWEEFPEAVDSTFETEYRRAMETQEPVSFEAYFPPLETWFAVKAYPSETGLSVYFRDVSARKEREQHLERYATIVETLWDGVYALDPDGRFVMANDAFLEMTGYEREELMGKPASVVHSDAVDAAAAELARGVEDEEQENAILEFDLRTSDGGSLPVESRFGPYRYDEDSYARTGVVRDITERRRFEEMLTALNRSSRDLLGAASRSEVARIVLDTTVEVLDLPGAGVYLRDPEENVLVPSAVSEHVDEIFGEMPTFGPDDDSIVRRTYESGEAVAYDDLSAVDGMHRRDTPLRSGVWIPLGDHGVIAIVSEAVDAFDWRDRQLAELLAANAEEALDRVERETTLKRRGDQLTRLNEKARELAAAEVADEVGEIAVSAASEALGLPLAAVELYDEEAGRLRPAARTSGLGDLVGDEVAFVSEGDVPWRVFLRNERVVYADADADERVVVDGTPLRSAVVLPLGKYGVFVGGSTEPGAFSEADVSVAEILAGNVVSALHRVDRERSLRERTAALEEQNENLERLGHINEVIRGIVQTLIRASTRAEIEQAVCDRLVGAEPYRFAWIGARDPVTEAVEPRAWAGVERGYLDRITVTADDSPTGRGPIGRAIRDREVQVQNDINFDREFEQWREAALERGYRSSVAVPIVYEETLYGVLALYGERSGLFNEMERAVLAELGEMVGYSLNALERKRALTGEHSIGLELGVSEPRRRWLECVDREGYEFELGSVTRREDGTLHAFYVVRGESVEGARSIGEDATAVEDVTLVSERDDGWLFTCTVRESAFLAKLIDRGAMPETVTAADGRARFVIRIPANAEIRTFVELFRGAYEDVDLRARRERTDPVRSLDDYRTELADRLTDRQREILQTAYASGFFDWPRGTSAQELAEVFGVSQPTISRHLRRGEEKLFSMLFGDEEE